MPTDPTPADFEAAPTTSAGLDTLRAMMPAIVAGDLPPAFRLLSAEGWFDEVVARARSDGDAAGYARGRADGLREAAEVCERVAAVAIADTSDSEYEAGRAHASKGLAERIRSMMVRALAPHPEPTPGPRVGDPVTAANVGALPVGTMVRWEHRGEEWRAERVEPDLWRAGGIEYDDEEIADEGGPVTTIASLPRVGGGGS